MKEDKRIDDIIAMLDQAMSTGTGHMNISVDENGEIQSKTIETMKSTDCAQGDLACCVPTLFEGLDTEDDID